MNRDEYNVLTKQINLLSPSTNPFMAFFQNFRVKEGVENMDGRQVIASTSFLYEIKIKVHNLKNRRYENRNPLSRC